jgi:peroxiredoxin
MFRFAAAVLVACVVLLSPAQAGKFNKKVSIGQTAPVFSDLPGTDDKKYSLGDFKDKDVVVVVITCNHCPVAVAYEDRIIALQKKYADKKVAVVAINVNKGESDRMPKMKVRAEEKGFNFPYVFDESQKIGRALGASVTPEFFVLNNERKIAYMGALDNSQNPNGVKQKYVENAVDALLKGETISTTETKARGCGVQYSR